MMVARDEPQTQAHFRQGATRRPMPMATGSNGKRPALGLANRRKWSDWGECSADCVRTRHRLHCDDLIQISPPNFWPSAEPAGQRPNSNKSTHSERPALIKRHTLAPAASGGADKLSLTSKQQQQDELLGGGGEQASERPATGSGLAEPSIEAQDGGGGVDDEQDYADEGDEEEGGNDSCARVESSLTFEEQTCSGGQCKHAPILPASEPAQARARQRAPKGEKVAAHNGLQPQQQRQQTTVSNHQQRLHVSKASSLDSAASAAPHLNHQINATRTRDEGWPAPVSGPQIELARWPGPQVDIVGGGQAAGRPAAAAAGANLQSQHLIQLTLLSGALVALILFTLLLLRQLLGRRTGPSPVAKLKPSSSYHWMLARQTGRQEQAACCQARGALASLECGATQKRRHQLVHSIESSSSGADTTTSLVRDHQQQQLASPSNAAQARLWWGQAADLAAAGAAAPAEAERRQYFVDLRGHHFAAGPFTQHQALLVEPASYYCPQAPAQRASLSRPTDESEYDDAAMLEPPEGARRPSATGSNERRRPSRATGPEGVKSALSRSASSTSGSSSRPDRSSSASNSANSLSVQSATAQLVSASQSQGNELLSSFELPGELPEDEDEDEPPPPPVGRASGESSSPLTSSMPSTPSAALASPGGGQLLASRSARARGPSQQQQRPAASKSSVSSFQSQPSSPAALHQSAAARRQRFAPPGHRRQASTSSKANASLGAAPRHPEDSGHFYEEINR